MRIGMNLLLWTAHYETREHGHLLDRLQALGYDGAEFSIGGGTVDDYRAIAARLQDLGLGASAVCAPGPEANPASPDPAVRARAGDWLRERVDLAHALGAEILCGPNHSAFAQFTRREPQEQEYGWSAEVLAGVGDHAQAAGVTLALEALNRFECYLCNTAEQVRGLVDRVNHPAIRSMLDTHHANIEEKNIEAAIATLGDTLVHVHICENDRGAPGSGQVNFDKVFAALAGHGYDGWLTIESFSRSDLEFANAINVWREYSTPDDVCTQGLQLIREQLGRHYT
jgi:D-psicose/D-tagatose/L-ribulose 3-epimerase